MHCLERHSIIAEISFFKFNDVGTDNDVPLSTSSSATIHFLLLEICSYDEYAKGIIPFDCPMNHPHMTMLTLIHIDETCKLILAGFCEFLLSCYSSSKHTIQF